jgi:hypothetical protein
VKAAEPKIQKLALGVIAVDMAIQPRAHGLNQAHVEEIAEAYRAGEPVEPPVVWKITDGPKGYKLSQGFHRLEAARRAGLTHLDCVVMSGTELKCLIDAMTSNRAHGLKRTNDDKRRCVAVLLEKLPKNSDRSIAELAGVGHTFVASIRGEKPPQVESDSTCPSPKGPPTRTGKDGKQYPAAKPKPAEAGAEAPAETLAPADVAADPEPVAEPGIVAPPDDTPAEHASTEAAPEPVTEAEPEADPAGEFVARMNRLCAAIDRANAEVAALLADPLGSLIHGDSVTSQLTAARQALWLSRPTEPCPACPAGEPKPACRACRGCGRTSEATAKRQARAKGRAA